MEAERILPSQQQGGPVVGGLITAQGKTARRVQQGKVLPAVKARLTRRAAQINPAVVAVGRRALVWRGLAAPAVTAARPRLIQLQVQPFLTQVEAELALALLVAQDKVVVVTVVFTGL